MLIAIHEVTRYAHCFTWSEALGSMLCKGEISCSLLYKGESSCSLLHMD